MILLFVLRSFRVGIELKYEELIQVNERRRSEKRSHYVEKSAAMKIYGSNQKNIKDKLTLVQFSDLGINEEANTKSTPTNMARQRHPFVWYEQIGNKNNQYTTYKNYYVLGDFDSV